MAQWTVKNQILMSRYMDRPINMVTIKAVMVTGKIVSGPTIIQSKGKVYACGNHHINELEYTTNHYILCFKRMALKRYQN